MTNACSSAFAKINSDDRRHVLYACAVRTELLSESSFQLLMIFSY